MKAVMKRFISMALFCAILMSLLIAKLGDLTLADGSAYSSQAEERALREVTLKGMRGRIVDRNGIVLAYNKTCYNVEFLRDADNRTDYYSAKYTESLIKVIDIIKKGGGSIIDTSYIQMDENGNLYYDWGVENPDSQKKRYYNFCSAMGFYVTEEIMNDPAKWKTPESAYNDMCKSWHIPKEMAFEDAVDIISVRQEANLNNYKAYEPITIAYDVGVDVVSQIQMRQDELVGIQVSESTTRVYPYGETAAHIVGYLQRSATEEMIENDGYSYNDYVGVSGVESFMESYLTGSTTEHHGKRVIKVNRNGSEISEESLTPATNGSDVVLTIDLPLQMVVDDALEAIIAQINEKEQHIIEENREDYTITVNGVEQLRDIKTAQTGAIVVLDVNTGDVLAMSSYPSYDPNWFIEGLTDEQLEFLMGESAADTTPLRNKAVSARLAPGSIFKMVTGFAGLMENVIDIDETIDDNSPYILYNDDGEPIVENAPRCWTKYPSKHKNQDITLALTNSCNYYFYEVSNRLDVDKLNKWAAEFGLTEKTGVELTGEVAGMIGGQEVWFDNAVPLDEQKSSMPRVIFNSLRDRLVRYVKLSRPGQEVTSDSEVIRETAWMLMELQDGSLKGKGADIRNILTRELGIPQGVIRAEWVTEIVSDLMELQWKDSQTIRSGIGQGSTLVTPVAVARYVAAVANRGTVYKVNIVDSILDENGNTVEEFEPTVVNKIEADDRYWDAIHKGLEGVVSPEDQGTAANSFSREFVQAGYTNRISGKTGSAQIGSTVQIDIQNTSWFVTYSPREDSEIAIVVCVPYGYSGSSSVGAVEDIITYYYERKEAQAPENLGHINQIVP